MKQKGRSMIEMLGVLAIIGVLSIGGIALYRRAVNNHHANTILDDVNRFAFVITEKGGFPANDNITNVNFEKTSTYEMVAFVGEKSGQYGIMVENVPKGVCEPLVDKASVEYKVRVAAYGAIEYLDQDTSTGLVYDSFHKDICVNDMNDVILYFGDTSAQCNKPDEGQDGNPCNSNAECCGTHFCAFQNPISANKKGDGVCLSVDTFGFDSQILNVNGTQSMWTTSTKEYKGKSLSWWSAMNWCTAQGLNPVTREDIGCDDVLRAEQCTDTKSPFLKAIHSMNPKPWKMTTWYWLEKNDIGWYNYAYAVHMEEGLMWLHLYDTTVAKRALCH